MSNVLLAQEKNKIQRYHIPSPKRTNHLLNSSGSIYYTNTRSYCTKNDGRFSHVDEGGKAKMVDVGDKDPSKRVARAKGCVRVGARIIKLITDNNIKKGDVLTVAQIAGIMAAKRTSEIIPLCHNIPLSSVTVRISMNETSILISGEAHCIGTTGVEMEALTAVSVAALTIYDMCKSVSHNICIEHIMLVEKDGGKSHYVKYNTEPILTTEAFAPIYV